MPARNKGKKLTLGDFQGTAGYDKDALPTGPSGDRDTYGSRGGRYGDRGGDRYGGGGGRYGDRDGDRYESGFRSNRGREDRWGPRNDDSGDSRADGADQWRTAGRSGRFGDGSGSRFNRDRDRWGDDRGDSGSSSGYTRLNLRRKGEAESGDVRSTDSTRNTSNSGEEEKKVLADRKFALDDVSTVKFEEKDSALEKAMASKGEVDATELAEGLASINLNEAKGVSACIAKSIFNSKLSLKELASAVEGKTDARIPVLVSNTLKHLQTKQGAVQFVKSVRSSGVDFVALIAEGKTGKDLDEFLAKKNLHGLKPIGDLRGFVESTFTNGSADDVFKHISSSFDDKVIVSDVSDLVCAALSKQIFADPKNPDLSAIDSFAPLMKRVLCVPVEDTDGQKNSLFQLQGAWFDAGKAKGVIKQIFVKSKEAGFFTVDAFNAWKEDSKNKTKGKMPALLQVNSWIDEIQPIVHEPDEGDDEEEDEDEGEEEEEFDGKGFLGGDEDL